MRLREAAGAGPGPAIAWSSLGTRLRLQSGAKRLASMRLREDAGAAGTAAIAEGRGPPRWSEAIAIPWVQEANPLASWTGGR